MTLCVMTNLKSYLFPLVVLAITPFLLGYVYQRGMTDFQTGKYALNESILLFDREPLSAAYMSSSALKVFQ